MSVNGANDPARMSCSHIPRRGDAVAEQVRSPRRRSGSWPSSPARVLAGEHVVLGMRHQPEHVAGRVRTRRRSRRPSRWGWSPRSAARPGRPRRAGRIGVHVAALTVRDRAVDRVVDAAASTRSSRVRRFELDPAAVEAPVVVVAEGAGEEAGAGEHLETVADADHGSARGHELLERVAEPDPRSSASMLPAPSASP
jgi:hypothetical protein